MAQIKLLKLSATDGVPEEFTSASDEITLTSFTVAGGGPVLSATGLDLNNQDVVDVNDLAFNNPATATINPTAGALIIDNIMRKEGANLMTATSDIRFPSITDDAGEVDAFKIPELAAAPTATPTNAGAGYLVYDNVAKNLYLWDGAEWDNLNQVVSAEAVENIYTAEVALAARDVVYISSADSVSKAKADAPGTAQPIGFSELAVLITDPATIKTDGIVSGFSGLTAGAKYYLSGATGGAITATVPTGTGHTVVLCGYAKSATQLQIQFDYLGRRS